MIENVEYGSMQIDWYPSLPLIPASTHQWPLHIYLFWLREMGLLFPLGPLIRKGGEIVVQLFQIFRRGTDGTL